MSLFAKILAGAEGTIIDQIHAGVVYKWWSRGREKHGPDVVCGALISGYADGTAVIRRGCW